MRATTVAGRLAATSAIVLIFTGCGSARTPESSASQGANTVLRELAACFRAHGLPDFPDPVVGRDGAPRFPDSAPRTSPAEQRACSAIADRLPGAYSNPPPVVSAAKYHQLLRFAGCVRANGFADWPDPTTRGQFELPPRIQGVAKSQLLRALHACNGLNPDR